MAIIIIIIKNLLEKLIHTTLLGLIFFFCNQAKIVLFCLALTVFHVSNLPETQW